MVLLLLVFLFYTRNTTQVGSKVVKKVVFIPAGGSWYYQKKNNFMAPFYRWGSTVSGVSHFEVAVYFLSLSSQKFLVLVLLTSEGWKAESTLEPPSGFEHRTPGLGIQRVTTRPLLHCTNPVFPKYKVLTAIVIQHTKQTKRWVSWSA